VEKKTQNVFEKIIESPINRCLTKRAADWWDSAPFSSIFMALGFSCSPAESTPAHQRLTQTVGTPLAQQSKKAGYEITAKRL
jgi:hypothetical protein